jgi:hypothetical protein
MNNLTIVELLEIIKILILSSVFFVWVVRYQNIVNEFKQFKYPDWLRDLVGILKLGFAIMLQSSKGELAIIGASGIVFLMLMAIATHVRIKSKITKVMPSLTLLLLALFILSKSL